MWLAEVLRTRSCINKSVGHQLSIVPGKAAETVEVIAECIDKAFEIWTRIRAFFMTLSHVSILDIKWFPLQSAMAASEHVLSFITSTYEGRTPPVKFLVQAWASTVHYFSEQVRITSLTAHDVISNIGAWEHKWKWSGSQAASSSNGGVRLSYVHVMNDRTCSDAAIAHCSGNHFISRIDT